MGQRGRPGPPGRTLAKGRLGTEEEVVGPTVGRTQETSVTTGTPPSDRRVPPRTWTVERGWGGGWSRVGPSGTLTGKGGVDRIRTHWYDATLTRVRVPRHPERPHDDHRDRHRSPEPETRDEP